jgi:glycosyltransferase involved in cell wall biosynthesis
MNIALLCTSPSWGGLEMNVLRLALRMRDRGHAVIIYAGNATPFYEKALENNFTIEILTIRQPYIALAAARQLGLSLQKQHIQILIFSYAKDNYVSSWTKYFFHSQFKLIYLQQMELGINKKGLIQTLIYRQLDAWITPLHVLAKQVLEKTYISAAKVRVIPLGVDTGQFAHSSINRVQARSRLHLPQQAFIAGIIGRIDPDKGQEYLIKAIPLLLKKDKEVHVLIVGEESRGDTRRYPAFLHKLVQELNIEKYVHFRPFTEHTEEAFAALDIFVMASRSETYGMVTVEAMASGLPVIGTNTGGTPELLDCGASGILMPPSDEYALADALEKLVTNQELRQQLAQSARQRAIARYDYRVQCDQLDELLKLIG